MARFLIIGVIAIYMVVLLTRLITGQKLSVIDWVGLILASAATFSMVYYIFTTN